MRYGAPRQSRGARHIGGIPPQADNDFNGLLRAPTEPSRKQFRRSINGPPPKEFSVGYSLGVPGQKSLILGWGIHSVLSAKEPKDILWGKKT